LPHLATPSDNYTAMEVIGGSQFRRLFIRTSYPPCNIRSFIVENVPMAHWHPQVSFTATSLVHYEAWIAANGASDDLVAEYLQTYVEWRDRYGLQDACMEELLAAVLAECERVPVTRHLHGDLRSLAHTIEAELRAAQEAAA
jgi:hypothetical protein